MVIIIIYVRRMQPDIRKLQDLTKQPTNLIALQSTFLQRLQQPSRSCSALLEGLMLWTPCYLLCLNIQLLQLCVWPLCC